MTPTTERLRQQLRRGVLRAKREKWFDWIASERDEHAVANGCYFDARYPRRVETFFSTFLRHSKAPFAGQPFNLLLWQRNELIYPVYGWRAADGSRRYRRVYCEVPKKNGKSTLMAGVALWGFLGEGTPGAEVYTLAGDRDQASIIFTEAAAMVAQSAVLSKHIVQVLSKKRMVFPRLRSIFQVMSSDAGLKHGYNPTYTIFDELHVQKKRDLWEAFEGASVMRVDPLHWSITTAGEHRNSICWEQHEYAQNLLDGVFHNDAFLPLIYAAAYEDPIDDEATWKKANPSYGVTLQPRAFVELLAEVKAKPRSEPNFRRLHLNQWVQAAERWLPLADWDACREPFALEDLRGQTVSLGLDLSGTSDLTALALCCRRDGKFYFLTWYWAPETKAAERQAQGVTYETWAREANLTLIPQPVIDESWVFAQIEKIAEVCQVQRILYDRWHCRHLAKRMIEANMPAVEFPQRIEKYAAPTKAFEEQLLLHNLRHNGDPCLRWQIDLVQPEEYENGNKRPSKKRSRDRIDGVVACIMAFDDQVEYEQQLSVPAFA